MAKKTIKHSEKKSIIISGIVAGVAALAVGHGKTFKNMKSNAKAEEENARHEAAKE